MKDFIEYLLKQIVKNEDAVKVEEVINEGNVDIRIQVASDDMGLVIGKEGKTIRSIRSLARAKAIRENIRVNVELLEPENAS